MALLCSYFAEYVVFNNYVIEYIFEVYVKYVVVTQRAVMEFFNSCFCKDLGRFLKKGGIVL